MTHSHSHRIRNLTGIPGPTLTPGSDDWLKTMSASKVAAVLGLSPWTSRFTLWHQMAGNLQREPETDVMARGHYLEPAVTGWFAAQHPDWKIIPTGTWTRHDVPWATASPDRLALVPTQGARAVEIKTTTVSDGWGAAGSDDIPPGVRAQVMWQMFVTGARITHVAALLPFLEFREYVIAFDEDESHYIAAQARAFMASLRAGDAPGLDGTDSTYQALRELHPDIDGTLTDIEPTHAYGWLTSRVHLEGAKAQELRQRNLIVDAMGNAQKALCNGWTLGSRISKNGGTPYFSPARTLPTPEQVLTLREDNE